MKIYLLRAAKPVLVLLVAFFIFISSSSLKLTEAENKASASLLTPMGEAVDCEQNGLWVERARILATDGFIGDSFGDAVAIDGNTAVVGTFAEAAYVFVRTGGGWTQQQKLTVDASFTGLGASVAIDGDTIVVGAVSDTVGGNVEQGSAYVFVRNGTTWSLQQRLVASNGLSLDGFGTAVAIDGDTIVVGSPFDDVGDVFVQGSAYVYVRDAGVWTEEQILASPDGELEGTFGISVGISGDTIIIGEFQNDGDTQSDQGAAYIFARTGSAWSLEESLHSSFTGGNQFFGISVGISGDTVVVGALAAADSGLAFVSVRSGGVWAPQQVLFANDRAFGDFFGKSVSISGETIVVGSEASDIGAKTDQGAAYVFVRSGTIWNQQQKITASNGFARQFFGFPVAISGNTIFTSVESDTTTFPQLRAPVYIFDRVCLTITACMEDESKPGNKLLLDASTGDYVIICDGLSFTGKGSINRKGNTVTLTHNTSDRRVSASFTGGGINKGSATLQSPPGKTICTIRDNNTANNSCLNVN